MRRIVSSIVRAFSDPVFAGLDFTMPGWAFDEIPAIVTSMLKINFFMLEVVVYYNYFPYFPNKIAKILNNVYISNNEANNG